MSSGTAKDTKSSSVLKKKKKTKQKKERKKKKKERKKETRCRSRYRRHLIHQTDKTKIEFPVIVLQLKH